MITSFYSHLYVDWNAISEELSRNKSVVRLIDIYIRSLI